MSTELHPVGSEAQRAVCRGQDTQIMRPANLRVGGNFDCLIHQCLCQAAIQHHASRDKELTTFQVPGLNSWMFCLKSNRNSSLLRFYPSTQHYPSSPVMLQKCAGSSLLPPPTTPLFSGQKPSSCSYLLRTGEADSSLTEASDPSASLFLTVGRDDTAQPPSRDM